VRTSNGVFAYSASAVGSLVYLPGFGDREKLLVDRRGEVVDTLRQRGTGTQAFASVHPWVAMSGANQLWLYDLDRGIPNRLVSREDGSLPYVTNPAWSPADSLLAFGSCGLGVVRISDLVTSPLVEAGPRLNPTDWSADGGYLIVNRLPGEDAPYTSVAAHDLQGDSLIALVEAAADIREGSLSPDMRWLAYRSSETGNSRSSFAPSSDRVGQSRCHSREAAHLSGGRTDGSSTSKPRTAGSWQPQSRVAPTSKSAA